MDMSKSLNVRSTNAADQNFLLHLIDGIRHQMAALDTTLDLLVGEISATKSAVTDESKLQCPKCCAVLGDENDITCMGQTRQYACPDCDFRGSVR